MESGGFEFWRHRGMSRDVLSEWDMWFRGIGLNFEFWNVNTGMHARLNLGLGFFRKGVCRDRLELRMGNGSHVHAVYCGVVLLCYYCIKSYPIPLFDRRRSNLEIDLMYVVRGFTCWRERKIQTDYNNAKKHLHFFSWNKMLNDVLRNVSQITD